MRNNKRFIVAIALIASLALSVVGQFILSAKRPDNAPMLAEGTFAALGAFRSLAAEAVWFRADRLQEEGRYVELAQLASTLAFLEPHTPDVWSYAAWNLAYNISIMMPTDEDRWRWVSAAIKLLRDEGLRLNPSSPELCRELAWLFQLKIGGRLDSASPLYREKWKAIVENVSSRDAWEELAMEPSRMQETEKRLGMKADWTNPFASSLYWALEGLPGATGNDKAFLSEIVRQSIILYKKTAK